MRKGFSLVELSISLVIIGLITGGIMAGQSLLKSAELKSIINESEKYISGAKMFRQKYDALPGDFANAEATWGTAHATDATCITTASTGTETCNGDEDGFVEASSTRSNEIYRFWQHLVNAGYIEGKFDGITHGINAYSSTAENSPTSTFRSAGWFTYNWSGAYAGNGAIFDAPAGTYINTLVVGGAWAVNSWPNNAILTPEETWNIDTKTDDGKPGTGRMVVYRWATCTNAANSADIATTYRLDSKSVGCTLWWPNAFRRE